MTNGVKTTLVKHIPILNFLIIIFCINNDCGQNMLAATLNSC